MMSDSSQWPWMTSFQTIIKIHHPKIPRYDRSIQPPKCLSGCSLLLVSIEHCPDVHSLHDGIRFSA